MIDADGDDRITLDELMDYQLKQGMEPDQVVELFSRLDSDHNGSLTLEEWIRGHAAYSSAGPPAHHHGPRMFACHNNAQAYAQAQATYDDYDLMYVEACYEQALEDEDDEAAFDAYYEQAIEDADAEIAAQVVVRRAANLPVVSLVDLKPEAITDEQLAEARRYLYTSTEGLAVGMTKLVTAKRLEQPEIATWMTLDEGEDRQKSKEELRAYKAALAKRSERKVEQDKIKRQQEIDARAQICDASWLR